MSDKIGWKKKKIGMDTFQIVEVKYLNIISILQSNPPNCYAVEKCYVGPLSRIEVFNGSDVQMVFSSRRTRIWNKIMICIHAIL